MANHPRIESKDFASFLTTRTRCSELWFVNNRGLEEAILGYTAKFRERYQVKLYALAIEGSHMHLPAHFPECNRAHFMRDLNSCVARAIPRYTPEYTGGRPWGKRYSAEFMPAGEDIEDRFFYTVLQPVNDGLVERISDYPWYNCFHDAIYGVKRTYKVVRWAEYNAAKRYNKHVSIRDFIERVTLQYERLPGYEHLSQKEYAKLMLKKLEERREKIVQERRQLGLGFLGREALLRVVRGSRAKNPKTSTIDSFRPRVLAVDAQRRKSCEDWYFTVFFQYKEASKHYRAGNLNVKFPNGTYRPYIRSEIGATTPGG